MNESPPSEKRTTQCSWGHIQLDLPDGQLSIPSLTISSGQFIYLDGDSGSGKTTLLRSLVALAYPPATIRLGSKRMTPEKMPEFRRKVILVSQEPLISGSSVMDALVEPLSFKANQASFPKREHHERNAFKLLKAMRISASILDQEPDNISRGEAQRLTIVRALLMRPRVLLLDEPTSALDEGNAQNLMEYLFNWMKKGSRTIMMTNHNSALADQFATDRWMIRVEEGRRHLDVY